MCFAVAAKLASVVALLILAVAPSALSSVLFEVEGLSESFVAHNNNTWDNNTAHWPICLNDTQLTSSPLWIGAVP